MSQLTHIVLAQFAAQLDKACYGKLTSRETNIARMLIGLDYLILNGNKLTARWPVEQAAPVAHNPELGSALFGRSN